ncbi:MAG: ABC transporter ATP-binding protein [Acidobacteriota bacterium]|nr:ABC transporter ATP-binding protein [Acidobacteriota bacterium]
MSGTNEKPVVQAKDLRKRYGSVEALRGINFEIQKGEVFGLLGPNGAGKTTAIEILEGLRRADSGTVQVCGFDPSREAAGLKQRIGAQLQSTVLPDKIRVEEALRLYAGFYSHSLPVAELVKRFGLEEKRRAYFEKLSGGQKQRLALALTMVNDPDLVLLDEPTAGLDAMVRREIYSLIEHLRSDGRTVLLTTHYIEEAERLCDRVAIVNGGQVIALGTPQELIQGSGRGVRMEARTSKPLPLAQVRQMDGVIGASERDGICVIDAEAVAKAVVALVHLLEGQQSELLDLHIVRPSLEDVFVQMTGRRIGD